MPEKKINPAVKNPLLVSCFVCAAGSFGAFFRWLQNMLSFEKDTVSRLMMPTAWPYIIILFSVAVIVTFELLIRKLQKQGYVLPSDSRTAFRNRTILLVIAAWIIGIMMFVGGVVTMAQAEVTDNVTLLNAIGIFAMLSGVGFPVVCTSSRRKFSPNLVCVCMYCPVIMLCLWLVYSYTVHSTVPETWVYCVEIVAICVALFAFLFNIGYPADKAKPKRAVVFSMLGSFFCFMTLSDERSTGLTMLMLSTALMLLLENWLVVSNAKKPEDEVKDAKPEKAEEPVATVEELAEEVVIAGGGDDIENAPTVDASDSDVKEWKGSKKK